MEYDASILMIYTNCGELLGCENEQWNQLILGRSVKGIGYFNCTYFYQLSNIFLLQDNY